MDAEAASALLHEAWTKGTKIGPLHPDIRPRTRAEGYAVQTVLTRRFGGGICGWKIAGTNEAGRRHINVSAPIAGPMPAACVLAPDEPTSLTGTVLRVAEPEFAFRMARDLPPRATPYSAEEAADAAESLHPAIEIPDTRFADVVAAGEGQLIADLACAYRFRLGPAAPAGWRSLDLAAHRISAAINDRPPVAGVGRNVMGGPCAALAWLVNELSGYGITVRAGEVITTGVITPPFAVTPGDILRADFGTFGRVEARFV